MSFSNPHRTYRRPGPVLRGLSLTLALFLALPPRFTLLAGDILRGGTPSGQQRGSSGTANPTAAAVEAGAPNAGDTLARTTQALNAVQAMQAAARAAAKAGANNLGADPNHPGQQLPNVPNGLVTGGLKVAPGVPVDLLHPATGENPALWQGAKLPTQTQTGDKTDVTIVQTQQQALLNWETFNVGKSTSVLFDQTAGGANASQWIAFNKVNDPSAVPSQILGSLDAVGQIYLINANGIIFGGSSQVNVHTLTASALPINDNLIARGLLNNPDNQFLFSAFALPAGANGTPAFDPPVSNTPDGHYGDVTVQAGAAITSPTTADHVGGRVALIGANVTNDGAIETPDGQTILGAGLQVGLAAHISSDPSLRGLDVFVGQVGDYAGTATNNGLIDAPRADITMAGKTIDQFGFINSSTSVSLNGRVDLLAGYNAVSGDPRRTAAANPPPFVVEASGTVTLGPDSVTQILPELANTDRVVGTQLALPSQINVQGLAFHEGSNAIVLAPSANVAINAGTWVVFTSNGFPDSAFVSSGGQIYLDPNAAIDVAGLQNVSASVAENIVAAQLLGPELANSPLQRDGPLRGQTIFIDVNQHGTYNGVDWVGSPIADLHGYVNLVQRTIGELSTNGGTVSLNAGDSVVLQAGSSINVSGGWINYEGANVNTTQVVSGGHVFDISQATPDRVYDGILSGFDVVHSKWGVVETFGNPLSTNGVFQAGYTQGGNGGSLAITAPSMAVDGRLVGNTVAGTRQITDPPVASRLSLLFQAQDPTVPFFTISPFPPSIMFGANNLAPADPFALDSAGNPLPLRDDRRQQVILSPDLVNSDGFGNLRIDNRDGNITLPADIALDAGPRGSIELDGANIDIEGSLAAAGGTLTLKVYDISRATLNGLANNPGAQTPPPDPTRGHFVLGSTASLRTDGMITDLRPTANSSGVTPYTPNGGKIDIESFDAMLANGSETNVSGGVTVSGTGQLGYGSGGSIIIKAGQDLNIASVLGGQLTLDGAVSGFSGSKGGSLSILAPSVQIGGAAAAHPGALLLTPDFFNGGGFSTFSIAGLGAPTNQTDVFVPAVVIASGTVIQPVTESLIAQLNANGPGTLALSRILLPQGVRAPVSLSFNAAGVKDPLNPGITQFVRGDFVMEAAARIETDPLASVSISANTAAVLGSIITPGGNISVSGGGNSTNLFSDGTQALVTVDLGPQSLLSAAGTTLLLPNSQGFRTGSVLKGGNVAVSGNIAAEAGSVLDVSGATGVLDLDPGFSGSPSNGSAKGANLIPTRVDSNGGSITLKGAQELFSDATLLGAAGGAGAIGGSLSVSSGIFIPRGSSAIQTARDIALVVTQSGPTITAPFYGPGQTGIGHAVGGLGLGHFAVDSFEQSGLDSVSLLSSPGAVQFSGPVTINARGSLLVANGGVIYGDAAVTLNAAYVSLGTAFRPPFAVQDQTNAFSIGSQADFFAPQYGNGTLSVSASLIDVGNLSLQGIGSANLVAANGDVRGDGTFDIAGSLSITAGQIYPATETSFTLAAYDFVAGGSSHAGSIMLASSGTRPLPFSAGGHLNVYSSIINDGGVLRAPIGTINIGFDGTGTVPIDQITGQPVPVTQQANLLASSVTSVSAIDPATGKALIIPYGFNPNGTAWIDPTGTDITVSGVPMKSVNIEGANVTDQVGSTIDIRGGGDLYAYQFQTGVGGTIDITNTSSSFAVIPNYGAGYAPYAAYNSSSVFGSDIGYTNTNLAVGDQVFLNASSGLPAGMYTLLPARYALLAGAFLVTPKSGTPTTVAPQADGSAIVSGYRINGFDAPSVPPLFSSFEVASSSVVRTRAEYNDFSANSFLRQSAIDNNAAVPRLPIDSGHLLFDATQTMSILGSLSSQAPSGGRGGQVDISSPLDILITGAGGPGAPNELVLDASALSAFGAESLLIGGFRQTTINGTAVTVTTSNVTVDNAGTPLTGSDLILVANDNLTLASGADIEQSGTLAATADSLVFGNAAVPGSGDGVLLRVSADPMAQSRRLGVSGSTIPHEIVGANAKVAGKSVTLDSTSATSLDPTAVLSGSAVNLNSGQISIQLPNGATPQNTNGLVLAGVALQNLQSVDALSLLSYSSIDIYGTGQLTASNSLALHAGEIRGFNDGGTIDFMAKSVVLDNSANSNMPGVVASQNGTLQFDAETVQFGANTLQVDQFTTVNINALSGILLQGTGSFSMQGDLAMTTPIITAAGRAVQNISASGSVTLSAPVAAPATAAQLPASGLGAQLSIVGTSVADNTDIVLPSGVLTLHATSGDVTIGDVSATKIDVGGTAQTFFDLVKYTSGGQVNLVADHGSVNVDTDASINVAAQNGGGNAGMLSVSVPNGAFVLTGTLSGATGANGHGGSFSLDVRALPQLGALDAALDAAAFTDSRSIRVRDGDVLVDGTATSRNFDLSADQGSITVAGIIDASGATGGAINLDASGSVILQSGSVLTVAAQNFDSAGKGGAVSLGAGSEINGVINPSALLDIQSGSTINLSVAANVPASTVAATANVAVKLPAGTNGDETITATSAGIVTLNDGSTIALAANTPTTVVNAKSVSLTSDGAITFAGSLTLGDFTGTLHLRAPQTASNTDLQSNPVNGTIVGASKIVVEGYALFDLTGNGAIDSAVQNSVNANATTFAGTAGTTTPSYSGMVNRLFANNQSLLPLAVIEAGAEIINRSGNLTLGAADSPASTDWDLSTYRFGPNGAPGMLTLRAANNLIFFNALSDGFVSSAYDARLLTPNAILPANEQSWSYRLTAASDFDASDFHRVQALSELSADNGSLLLGKDYGTNLFPPSGANASTVNAVSTRFQVIRTGSGDIDISAGRDVKLLNQFATIYTAGTEVADPTLGGTFDVPITNATGQQSDLGAIQQRSPYPAQYSMAGGNVTISAREDIVHQTQASGVMVDDSSRELPINWLYRRGFVDPNTGLFKAVTRSRANDIGSTTWWVDESNFFEGVGALGGGNVTVTAGHDVRNIDAMAPTNARMAGKNGMGNPIAPNAANLLELGGGDVAVMAGNNIDGGVYYVERGQGTLAARGNITTNATRSPSLTNLIFPAEVGPEQTWLPTTLFVGKAQFDVSATGNLLIGPAVNPFLLPGGINNTFWYKTYFSTYGANSGINVSSLAGDLTFREALTLPSQGAAEPILRAWLETISVFQTVPATASFFQPWLRLDESIVEQFSTFTALLPPSLSATAFAGNLNLVGNMTLFPSSTGTIDFAAHGSVNALQPSGASSINGATLNAWTASTINLSDADPGRVPGINSPFAFRTTVQNPVNAAANQVPNVIFLKPFDSLFAETGSTQGNAAVLQNKQTLHAAGLLHAGDPNPVHIYSATGDISGLTLFAGKSARVVAGQDITDISFYIQNVAADDLSVIAAGRDLIAFDPNSALRVTAQSVSQGNALNVDATPAAGDIQISGPGTLEVLAGRNFDLGVGPNNSDGTALGITSIGNARNPSLPFQGADIIAGAGIGAASGLANSKLDFAAFNTQFLDPSNSTGQSARYLPELGKLLGLTNATDAEVWAEFQMLPAEKQSALSLDVFYLVLRDAGRDRNDPASPNFGNFDQGMAAVAALFPGDTWKGDVSLTSREIKTRNGGNITIFAPGGQLSVGLAVTGAQALDQGILTEHGGNISIFTKDSVNVGTSRIFTLRGGNEIIWSSEGDIAAGASSKTVQSAPPTRVLIDPQSADVQTDLAGLATGGGIGVLESVAGVPPSDVDLIAPKGTIDAGDAGIRVSGNLNLAAVQIINAGNISVGGASVGVPTVAAPNIGSLTSASNTTAATSNAAQQLAGQNVTPAEHEELPSIISVEVLGYGGETPGQGPDDEEEDQRKKKRQPQQSAARTSSLTANARQLTAASAGSM